MMMMTPRRLALLLTLLTLTACHGPQVLKPTLGPPVPSIRTEPTVRIRVIQDLARLDADGPATLTIGPLGQPGAARVFSNAVTVTRRGASFAVISRGGESATWATASLAIDGNPTVRVNGAAYPRRIVLVGRGASDRFDVVNHAPLDDYLPGVLDRELYPRWQPAAYAAQAVAARSYALFCCHKNQARSYDMESTQASQAYGGTVLNPLALQAVQKTRGVVLSYDGRVLPAYYSSSSGGTGQDAAIAFADGADIPPLRGRAQGGWDAQAHYYRWGPIVVNRGDLSRRIAQWGAANGNPVSALGDLRGIECSATNAVGRPARFTLTDTRGRRYALGPEQFRFACNYGAAGGAILRSSHVSVRVVGDVVQFWDGRGYGHGVGMSQWGAQAMAEKGYEYPSILAFYYPGATLERIY